MLGFADCLNFTMSCVWAIATEGLRHVEVITLNPLFAKYTAVCYALS